MAGEPGPSDPARLTARLSKVRWAAVLSILLFTAPFLIAALDVTSMVGWWDSRALPPVFAVSLLALCGPYLLTLWLLRVGAGNKGLALAASTGRVVLVLALLFASYLSYDRVYGWPLWAVTYLTLAVTQCWLVRNADALRKLLGPQTGATKNRALLGLVLYFPVPFYLALAAPYVIPHQRSIWNESSAKGDLRLLKAAADRYRAAYVSGFPANLSLLGSLPMDEPTSCKGTDLLHAYFGGGARRGYRLEYRPGAPVEHAAAGCPAGVRSYTVSARPVSYKTTGVRSFYMDESGVIRFTREDRPATADDPIR